MTQPTLRNYQIGILDAIEKGFFDDGLNRLLIRSGTGTGKTICFAQLPRRDRLAAWLDGFRQRGEQRGAVMLVIAHREELLRQAAAKIQAANPGAMVAIEQGDLYASRYADVVVASIQTLSARKYARLERLLEHHTFRIVVVDEAHHAAAATYRTTLARLGFLPMADASEGTDSEAASFDDVEKMRAALIGWDERAPKDRLLVGVTATPNRTDAIGLGCVFQSIAYSYGLKKAIEDQYLVPIVPWVIETSTSLEEVHTRLGDFKQDELADAVNNPTRNRLAVAAWRQHAEGLSTIAFTVDVQHAEDLAETFRAAGIAARALSGKTDKDERRQMLADFEAGRLTVICNCMVLTEGTDLPIAGCILHAKPTKSATLYEQMTGRGLRPYPGKASCIVLDLVDVARRHSLQTAPVLYGLPPNLSAKGQELRALEAELEALREKMPNIDDALESGRFTLAQLQARSTTFDVFAVPDMGELAAVVSLDWIRRGADTFLVGYPWGDGTETIKVEPDVLGKYAISLTMQPKPAEGSRSWPAPRQKTIGADFPTAAIALHAAEIYVQNERPSILNLKAKDAPWKLRPASDRMLNFMRRLYANDPVMMARINVGKFTMGEAGRAIENGKLRLGWK